MRIQSTLICLLLWCVAAATSYGQGKSKQLTQNPLGGDPAAFKAGKLRFESACSICHGVKGEGGRGSKLADSDYIREMTDQDIFDIIRNGIRGTEMMAF